MGYQIPFKSFKGADYVLMINGGGTVIDGSAQVFTTEEDADTDFFKPVRTQSGTFKYLGEGANDRAMWLAMIPQDALDIPVKLMAGNVVKWQGYIQPEVYQNDYPANGGLTEHEFSVQCPLSVLDTMDISTANLDTTPIVTIGDLLENYIFARLTGTTITDYYLQGTADATWSRLTLKVMRQNFIETDSTGVAPKYSLLEVLEEVCKVFGYTCRMHGTAVYFTMPVTKTGHTEVGFTHYTTLTNTTGRTYSARGTFNVTDAMFCDTEDNEQVVPGIGKAIVKSDINKADNMIELPYDELYDQYNLGGAATDKRPIQRGYQNIYCCVDVPDAAHETMEYDNPLVSLMCFMATRQTDQVGGKWGRFLVYDDNDTVDAGQQIPESKTNFSWKKCIELFHGCGYSGSNTNPLFRITSKLAFVLFEGYIYIDFKCNGMSVQLTPFFPQELYATCRLKVGNKYWNGTTWTTTESNFNLQYTNEGAKNNRSSYGGYQAPQWNGFGVPVSSNMQGILEFTVIDVPTWSYVFPYPVGVNGFLPMFDLKIGFVRIKDEDENDGNEYIEQGGRFKEQYNVDLIFASDVPHGTHIIRKMAAGYGYLMNPGNNPVEKIKSVDNQDVIAEQELAQVIAKYGMTTHRVVTVNLWSNLVGNVVPTAMSTGLETGMFPLAVSHDWWNDVTTITMIQV